jgi:hypothetical protein
VLLAQQPPRAGSSAPQAPPPTFRSAIEAVQVTVVVTDAAGSPVTGLNEADFEVLEDGKPQPITTFSAVDIPIERTERAIGEPDVIGNDGPQGRMYLIALDDMSPDLALRSRVFSGSSSRSTSVRPTRRPWSFSREAGAPAGRSSPATGCC